MNRIVNITVQLQLELASQLTRDEFFGTLETTLRSGLGDVLVESDECVTVIAVRDPQDEFTIPTELAPILEPAGEVAWVWTVEDIEYIRPDLTREQAIELLHYAYVHHDSGVGLNWNVLEDHAETLFGEEPDHIEASA